MNALTLMLAALFVAAPAVAADSAPAVSFTHADGAAPDCIGLPCDIINAVCQIAVHRNCVA